MKTLIAKSLRHIAPLAGNRFGNFAIMFALLAPVLLTAAGISIDLTTLVRAKTHLRSVTDAAALAASSALADNKVDVDEAKKLAIAYVDAQLGTQIGATGNTSTQFADVKIDDTPNANGTHTYDVALSVGYQVPLSGLSVLVGVSDEVVKAGSMTTSTSAGAATAASIFLAVDKSGSMKNAPGTNVPGGVNSKINALKNAVHRLADILKKADPSEKYVRTGAVSYSDVLDKASDLDWGESGITSYVDALNPSGDTNTTAPMRAAKDALKKNKEDPIHFNKNHQTPERIIVLMTDGMNSSKNITTDVVVDSNGMPVLDSNGHYILKANQKTQTICDDAKADGVIIYTIGFAAPEQGKPLLQSCATDINHYFDAKNADDLYKAFEAIGQAAAGKVSRVTG